MSFPNADALAALANDALAACGAAPLGAGDDRAADAIEQASPEMGRFFPAMDAALALVRPPENMADPAMVAQLQQYIDFDEFIDHLIVQMWGAQNDWMGPVFRGTPGVNLTDASRFFNKNWEAARRSRGPDQTGFTANRAPSSTLTEILLTTAWTGTSRTP